MTIQEQYENLEKTVRGYNPAADFQHIRAAFEFAAEAHKDQKRKSGEPYIIHPLWVGIILADLEMDKETIVAGMLHDTVEDTEMTVEDITREFGEEVALLVDGVTKLGQLSYSISWKYRRRISERCFWLWQRTSVSSSSSWQTVCIICGRWSL